MAVRIRLRRMGRKKQAHFRVVVTDRDAPRDGRFVENLGHYRPLSEPARLVLDLERVDYWLDQGATPSATVKNLIARARKGGDDQVAVGEEDLEAKKKADAEKLAAKRAAERKAAADAEAAEAEAEAEAESEASGEGAEEPEAAGEEDAPAEAEASEEGPAEAEAAEEEPEAAAAEDADAESSEEGETPEAEEEEEEEK
ncbi:MAG: 30S ribosomal protein S16 [Gemmatimonadota bacterium]